MLEPNKTIKKILLLLYKSYNSTTKNINFKEFFKIIKKEDYQRVVNFLNFHSDNSESYIWISSKKDDILNPENDDSLSINPKEGVNFLRELEKEEQNEKEYLLNKKSISIAVWQRNTSIILAILTLFLVIVGFFQWNTADKLKDVSSFQSEILNKQTEISEQIAIPNKAELKIMPIQELSNRSISIGRIKDNIMDGRNESFDLWIANTGRISTSYINFLYYTNEDLEISWINNNHIINILSGETNRSEFKLIFKNPILNKTGLYNIPINYDCTFCIPPKNQENITICIYELNKTRECWEN